MELSKEQLKKELQELGVKPGDTLFLRVSYKSMGPVEGGPITFINALIEVIGDEGTIIFTAFPYKHIKQFRWFHRKNVTSESDVAKPFTGILPVMSLSLPESMISRKLEFPFVVIGKNAEYLTNNHTHEKSGYWLLEEAIERFSCKCLRIGGKPFVGSTHIALSRVFREKEYYQRQLVHGIYVIENGMKRWYYTPNTTFCGNAFKKYVGSIVNASLISEGMIGNGYAILTDMHKSLEKECELFRKDIHMILCDNPDCLTCRISYSFSDTSISSFLYRQCRRLFSNDFKLALSSIKEVIRRILFAVPQQ